MALINKLKAIGDAIRTKTGKADEMTLDQMPTEIMGIQTGSEEDRFKKHLDATKSAYYLFYDFRGTSVDDLIKFGDTSNVTNAQSMFEQCFNLTTIPLFDTGNITNMNKMFYRCNKLTAIPPFDTSNVTNMGGVFDSCSEITTVPSLDTSNVTNMSSMFSGCNKLTAIPPLYTSSVTNMSSMFSHCYEITTIPALDTSNVTTMESMFHKCDELTTIPPLDTSKVTNMRNMFYGCYKLTTIPPLDARNVYNTSTMFNNTVRLTEIWMKNIKHDLTVGSGTTYGHLLTVESLVHLCNELRYVHANKTLTVGSANLEKLANVYVKLVDITDAMRAEDDLIDEKSPCVVCDSTDEGAMLISNYVSLKQWTLK